LVGYDMKTFLLSKVLGKHAVVLQGLALGGGRPDENDCMPVYKWVLDLTVAQIRLPSSCILFKAVLLQCVFPSLMVTCPNVPGPY
jgi:hypothetical protein